VLLREVDPVLLADAPTVTVAVGVTVTVVEPLTVVEGVGGGVAVPVPVAVIVGVAVPELEGVPVPLIEIEPVLDAETPAVSEDVGDVLTVLLALRVDEGVMDAVPVPELVGELVKLLVGVCVGVDVALTLPLPELEADAPSVRDAVGVADVVPLAARFKRLPARLAGPAGAVAGIALLAMVGLGSYIFYNTNVLNPYRTRQDVERWTANKEKAVLLWGLQR
jgi:hypothetical protein